MTDSQNDNTNAIAKRWNNFNNTQKITAKIVGGFLVAGFIIACVESTKPVSTNTTLSTTSAATTNPLPEVEPTPVIPESWDSDSRKSELEIGIKENFSLASTGAPQPISSVSCSATSTKLIWNCNIRKLGDPEAIPYRIEVTEDYSNWAGQPIY